MKITRYFSTIRQKINALIITFLLLCISGTALLYKLHTPVDNLRSVKLKTQKSLKILNDLTFNGQKVIHHESKFKRNFTQKIEDFEHVILDILENRHFNKNQQDTSELKKILTTIFVEKTNSSEEEVLLTDILDSWQKVKVNFLLIRDQPTYKDSIIVSYDPENEFLLDKNYTPGSEQVNTTTNVIFKKHQHHISTLNPALKEAWHYDDIYSEALKKQLEKLFSLYDTEENIYEASFDNYLLGLFFLIILYLLFSGIYLQKTIYTPLYQLQKNANTGLDNHTYTPVSLKLSELRDIQNLLTKQQQQINAATGYIEAISQNNNALKQAEVEGPLVDALTGMREKINKVREEEEIRNWETRGIAEFSEILRTENSNLNILTDKLIAKLVHFLGAVQGAIFLMDNETASQRLRLVSSYAYDRKKHLNKTIAPGEGLIGQVWQEKASIYLSDVPEDHFKLKSGLGQAIPKYVLIVPLKDTYDIYGVVELASNHEFKPYERSFVEHIAETIASSIASVQLSEKTNLLLQQAQDMAKKMQLHEEEMRQNIEELQSTQEDTLKREQEKEKELKLLAQKRKDDQQEWEKRISSAEQKIAYWKEKSETASVDNDKIRALQKEIEDLNQTFEDKEKDLLETIKIKDMRIEKLRKKLNN